MYWHLPPNTSACNGYNGNPLPDWWLIPKGQTANGYNCDLPPDRWLTPNAGSGNGRNGNPLPDSRQKVPVDHRPIILRRCEAGESQAQRKADAGPPTQRAGPEQEAWDCGRRR